MTEYTVHFQKGTKVGARRLRMIRVEAATAADAVKAAKVKFAEFPEPGFRVSRVDHFEDGSIVIDQ